MEASDSQEVTDGQQFSDIQNYLVTFNKDIANAGNASVTVLENSGSSNTGSLFAIDHGNDATAVEESVNNNNILSAADSLPEQDEISRNIVSGTDSQYMVVTSENNSLTLTEANLSQSSLQEEISVKAEDIDCIDSDAAAQISAVHDHIAQLSGKHLQNFNPQSVETLNINGKQVTLSLSQDGSQVLGHVVRMLSVEDSAQLQLLSNISTEQGVDTIASTSTHDGAVITENLNQDSVGIQNIAESQTVTSSSLGPPLTSGNSSSSNAVQIVTINQNDLNSAQLVALQNSSDSSQPQLVAVQDKDDTSSEKIHMHSTDTADPGENPVLLNADGKPYQTVTLMQPDVQQSQDGNDVNYVFVVQPPEEEKEEIQKYLPPGLNLFGSDLSSQDITSEEIIDEDGTVKRVLKINAKKIIGHIQSAPSPLMCHYCNYTSPKRYLLTRHLKSHSDDRPHKCQFCKRGFKTVAALQNHVNTHTGVRPHKCKECDSAFTTSGELVRHVRYRHTFEKPHKCTECDYASVELSKLKRHMRSHTGERPYQCTNCSYASPDTYKLKRHMRIHTGEKPYECDICHARFTQSNSLKAHKLIHSGNKPVFQCDLCPTTCGRKTDLKIHMQKLHMSEKPLECRKCGCAFPDRYTYKVHLKSHEGEKCFRCEHCDYAAMSFRHLEIHTLTHSDQKPFECENCDQTFRQKQLLKRHINLHHTPNYTPPNPKEKSFDCNECERSFAHKGNLLRHLQQHGNEGESSAGFGSHLLHSNLLADLREGKLGNSPQVVIVHPDGRVEEVTQKLQALQEKSDEEVLMSMVNKSISDSKPPASSSDTKKDDLNESSDDRPDAETQGMNTDNVDTESAATSQEMQSSTSVDSTSTSTSTTNSTSTTCSSQIVQAECHQMHTGLMPSSPEILPVVSQSTPVTLDQLVNTLPSTMECTELQTTAGLPSLSASVMSSALPSSLNTSTQVLPLAPQTAGSTPSLISSSLISMPVTVSSTVATTVDQTREAGTQAELEESDDDPKNGSNISDLASASDNGFAAGTIISATSSSDVTTIPIQSLSGQRTIVSHPDGTTQQVLVFNLGQDMTQLTDAAITGSTGEVDANTITYLADITTQFEEATQADLTMTGSSDANTFSPLEVGLVQLEQDDGCPSAKKQRLE